MLKKLCSAAAIAFALSAVTPTLAADLPSYKGPPIPPPPVFSWTGFYFGVNLGGGWRERHYDNGSAFLFGPFGPFGPFAGVFPVGFGGFAFNNNNDNNSGGVVGGGQSGFNYQFTPWLVVGYESDIQGTSIGSGGGNNNFFGSGGGGDRISYFSTIRGRIGVTPFDPRILIYGTGGFAYGEVRHTDPFLFGSSWSHIKTGWTAGGGVEWAPAAFPRWSVKVEYLYTDLSGGGWNNNFGFGFNNGNGWNHTRFHTVRAGLNYHFNLFSLLIPSLAQY